MISALMADGTDLTAWADHRDAQASLPQLIRKLIHGTLERCIRSDFRSGEGVQLGGWDGIVETEHGNPFVPAGISGWELGTSRDFKRKADHDYNHRTKNPGNVDPQETTFVCVTLRRWRDKKEWETRRLQEGVWRGVRVYDADNLAEWLEQAPPVHIWISQRIGKHPRGANDLDTFWQDWSEVTNPATPVGLVLAGRGPTVQAIHTWVRSTTQTLSIRADSQDEALAVFASAIQSLPEAERMRALCRTIVVRDSDAWNELAVGGGRLSLVRGFDGGTTISRAIRNQHTVVIPLGRAAVPSQDTIQVPRLAIDEAAKALLDMGIPAGDAWEFAKLARRSLTAFRRKLANSPAIQQPEWAKPKAARSVVPALLAGRWSDASDADREIISRLSGGGAYELTKQEFIRWTNEDDPPLRCVDSVWYMCSEEDAWLLLGRYLTSDDLDRFVNIVLDVFGLPDPRFDLPNEQRIMAPILGKSPRHSDHLRRGLADNLAFLGARGNDIRITGEHPAAVCIEPCVRKLLESDDWKVWASLPLEEFAEAAPDAFLDAIDRILNGAPPVIASLFVDEGDEYFSSPLHTKLLFALEMLTWSKDHLMRTAIILAKLAKLDPGGRWANRPINSLCAVFLPWYPQTGAKLEDRLRAIDALRQWEPDIAWRVMTSMLPERQGHAIPSARPRWRRPCWQDWAPDGEPRVNLADRNGAISGALNRMLHDVGLDGTRWSDLIEALPNLAKEQFDSIVKALEGVDTDSLNRPSREVIWNALRTLISNHRTYHDAEWALPKPDIDRLELAWKRFKPQDPVARYGWLFSNRPALPEGRERDWNQHEQLVALSQQDVLRAEYTRDGINGILAFVGRVARPELVGVALSASGVAAAIDDELLSDNLCHVESARRQFVSGYIADHVRQFGLGWARTKLVGTGQGWPSDKQAAFCTMLPFLDETWDIVDTLESNAIDRYWKTVNAWYAKVDSAERAVRCLIEHGRACDAVELLTHHPGSKLPGLGALIADALEQMLIEPRDAQESRTVSSHDVSELLAAAAASAEVDEGRMVNLEWAYLPSTGRHGRSPKLLHRELSRNPDFFADVVTWAFRSENDEPRESLDRERKRPRTPL